MDSSTYPRIVWTSPSGGCRIVVDEITDSDSTEPYEVVRVERIVAQSVLGEPCWERTGYRRHAPDGYEQDFLPNDYLHELCAQLLGGVKALS